MMVSKGREMRAIGGTHTTSRAGQVSTGHVGGVADGRQAEGAASASKA